MMTLLHEHYELLKTLIWTLPWTVMVLVFIFLARARWYKRVPVLFLVGWGIVALSTMLFWEYSFDFAPNEEIRTQVGMKDSAPRAFGTLFGWVYGLVILSLLELCNLLRRAALRMIARQSVPPGSAEQTAQQ